MGLREIYGDFRAAAKPIPVVAIRALCMSAAIGRRIASSKCSSIATIQPRCAQCRSRSKVGASVREFIHSQDTLSAGR